MSQDHDKQTRPVVSEDPSLSPEANRMLTDELRQVIGSDTVETSPQAPRHSREAHGTTPRGLVPLFNLRIELVLTIFILAVSFGVFALATDNWWLLIALMLLLLVGAAAVVFTTASMTGQNEHVSPTVAARLEEEGVSDPDQVLTELAEDYRTTSSDESR